MATAVAALAGIEIRRGRRTVLGPLDIVLEPGQFVGIVGPNGAGKSTLLRVLAGVDRPRVGSGSLLGRDLPLSRGDAHAVRQELAFLPQRHEISPELPFTVRDVIEFGRAGLADRSRDRSAIAEAVATMELAGFERRLYRELSGGEQQKVQLARLLARQARLLLLDEPTAGLDPDRRERLIEAVQNLANVADRTVIMVTHDLHDLPSVCSRVLLLRGGHVLADGAPAEVITDEHLSRLYGCRMHVEHHEGRFAAFSVGSPAESVP